MRDSIRSTLYLLFVLLSLSAFAEDLPDPRNSEVFGRDAVAVAKQLVGRGIELPGGFAAPRAFDAAGNEIVWREVRRSTDSLGQTHVFYRQHAVVGGLEAELYGSEVGVHFKADGAFRYAGGTQFETVFITNRPRFSRAEAVRRATDRLQVYRGEDAQDARPLVDEAAAFRAENTKLRLVQFHDEFRFAFFTFAEDQEGGYHSVVLDAEDDRILGVSPANPTGNCFPSDRNAGVDAIGIPIRSGVPNRVLRASVSSTRPSPFTHEGYYHTTSATAYPSQSVYQETNSSNFKCDIYAPISYTLFPLTTNSSGVVVYDDSSFGGWKGRVAGDALYHTYQTMRAFGSLGRKGWNGSNAEAKIIIESSAGDAAYTSDVAPDQAMFIQNPKDGKSMANTVVIGPADVYYNMAASLDLVAHEWGHGVIFDEVGLAYDTAVRRQIHEGYSDVIANIVEKLRQPAGYGLEQSSDWTMHEDVANSGYARGAHDDGSGHNWVGPNGTRTLNDRVHQADTTGTITGNHGHGTMLVMAYRLLAEGGRNEVCSRGGTSGWDGCASGFEVDGVGASKARWIMFQALYEMPSTVTWTTIANYVNEAAYELYNSCSVYNSNAHNEQQAVADAFLSIGYPRTSGEHACPP